MSTADHSRSEPAPAASEIAAQLCEADFVRLVTTPDGDALAATGVLAQTLTVPFQASVARNEVGESEADMTVTIGRADGNVAIIEEPLSVRAFEVAQALNESESDSNSISDPGPVLVLALAGIVAAERDLSAHTDAFDIEATDIDSTPGIGVPTTDLADGLAHTTLVHAPFSGDLEAATEALSDIVPDSATPDLDEHGRVVASMLALSVVREAKTRASETIDRAVCPYGVAEVGGTTQLPFATLAGYADVLDALARSWPGIGLALALGHDCYEAALDGWREHARAAHTAIHNADISRYRGLVVADITETTSESGTIGTVARLVRDYRSQEPVVLAIADDAVAGTAVERERDVTAALTEAVAAVDEKASATGRGRYAYAQSAITTRKDAFVDAFREAI
ncbi:hypothetical protein [Halocatena marina]|uniref:hypothetical protein n=1 Tax=Halocatena marina TaxID=2934937 RepID=UPI00200CD0C1|nr:hypothetical protein [Halocatena marina]